LIAGAGILFKGDLMERGGFDRIALEAAGRYDTPGSLPERVHRRLKRRLAGWLASLPVMGSVLDLGCGRGELAWAVARIRPDLSVTGLDSSAPMLDLAASLGPANRSPSWVLADVRHLPFPDKSFQTVILFDVLAHFDPRAGAPALIKEAARVCSGYLLVEVKTRWILALLLFCRRHGRGLLPRAAARFLWGPEQEGIPVYLHDWKSLLTLKPVKKLSPWPLLPAPSRVYVFEITSSPVLGGLL
jgi:SAM-dependent methyltransferase